MAEKITRRRALAAGTASTLLALGNGCGSSQQEQADTPTPEKKTFWDPGPDKNLVRDLTPGTTPIRLGGYLVPIKNMSYGDMVKKVRDDGFTGAHASAEPWNSLRDSDLREVQAALKEHDVYIFQVGNYTNMIHPDPTIRRTNLKTLCTAIEAADKLFAGAITTISGSCDPEYYFNVHPDNWTQETWDLLVQSCRQVLSDTAGMKAKLTLEAQVTTNIDGPKAHKRLIDDVGDPRCTVNLDTANMMHLYNYYHTTELIHECFDLLGENIMGYHVKDTTIFPDKQTVHVQECCPGRGVMDFESIFVRLSRMEWPRTVMPEHIPQDQFPEAYAHIKRVAEKVGVKFYG